LKLVENIGHRRCPETRSNQRTSARSAPGSAGAPSSCGIRQPRSTLPAEVSRG
jgi:hypothetical protein